MQIQLRSLTLPFDDVHPKCVKPYRYEQTINRRKEAKEERGTGRAYSVTRNTGVDVAVRGLRRRQLPVPVVLVPVVTHKSKVTPVGYY